MSKRTRHFIRAVRQANGGAYPSANDVRDVLEKVIRHDDFAMSSRLMNGAKNPDRSPYPGLAQRLGAK